jgi:hypothetical protein
VRRAITGAVVATGLRGRGGAALWVRIVVCAVVGCVALAVLMGSDAAAAASAWSIQATPNPTGATYSVLSGVSCASRTTCTAVGYFANAAGVAVPLAERWNGTNWSIQPTPIPARARSSILFSVSCASTTACVAVGSVTNPSGITVPLAERWNGSRWAIQRTPTPSRANGRGVSYLGEVSCASRTACAAVGFSGNNAGTTGVTLAERWNGSSWAIQRTPHPTDARVSFFSGVSCTSPRSCIATGFKINSAGAGVTLAERWDGTGWAIQPTPTLEAATYVQLVGVSCASPTWCTAAGFFSIVTGIEVMLAERWNGTGWAIQQTLYPDHARFVQFAGVSCTSPTSCTAVGFFNNVPGIDVTLAERWNGTRWAIQPTPNPAGATSNSLGAVSCPSTTRCTAVGGFTNGAGTGVTLAERYS